MDKEKQIKRFQKKEYIFSKEEKQAADGWTCCAIGSRIQLERPDIIKDIGEAKIKMQKLLTPKAFLLGVKFNDKVDSDDVEGAERVFTKIQKLNIIFRDQDKYYFPWHRFPWKYLI